MLKNSFLYPSECSICKDVEKTTTSDSNIK